jgi:chitinase
LSPARVLVALASLGALGIGGVAGVSHVVAAAQTSDNGWFAGYVDVTATPRYAFEDPAVAADRDVVLGFVVAAKSDACSPSWGAAQSLDGASTALDLDRRIARLRQRGGDVLVSFGGAANTDLATECTDQQELTRAYSSVIDRYDVSTIDLDIEGPALSAAGAAQRRAAAISAIQQRVRAAGGKLAVWLTLPVTPSGLDDNAFGVVEAMLAAHVDIAGVNAMTMDFGGARKDADGNVRSELTATEDALRSLQRQLGVAYQRAGERLSDGQLWSKVGATPMIGQNDIATERFELKDAEALSSFARAHGLGRVSMWSLNRDQACGPNVPDPGQVHDNCSGAVQKPAAFAQALGRMPGRSGDSAGRVTVADAPPQTPDDPATSPYAIWRADGAYEQGTKIVWHHNVYQAKWWAQGAEPDAPVLHDWDTPWQLIGPVLPGEHPVRRASLPAGTYPTWSAKKVYAKGTKVMFNGLGYSAKWWTQADRPTEDPAEANSSPWKPIS